MTVTLKESKTGEIMTLSDIIKIDDYSVNYEYVYRDEFGNLCAYVLPSWRWEIVSTEE